MQIIKKPNGVIYKANQNKKVKFKNNDQKFSTISLKHENSNIVEVDE